MSIFMLMIGFLVVLGPLVFFHELGHFVMAKRAGIRVLEFGFGFPPRLFKFWQGKGRLAVGGTRITIPANFKGLPISQVEAAPAFEQKADKPLDEQNEPNKATWDQDVLGIGDHVDVIAEKSKDGAYSLRKLVVLDPEEDDVSPMQRETPEGIHLRGEATEYTPGTIYSINWLLPLGGFVRMLGEEDPSAPDSFAAAPKRWRTAVLLAGPLMNLLLAIIILTAVWMVGAQQAVTCRFEVERVHPDTPAAVAGLLPQDFITQIDDEVMDDCYELGAYVRQRPGQAVEVKIERGGQTLSIPLKLRAEGEYDPTTEGPMGIDLELHALTWETHRANLIEALSKAGLIILTMVLGMLALPVMILNGTGLSNLMGPIGISQAGGEAIQMSQRVGTLSPILFIIGQVSVAVGLTNLLPLPALDGGRLLFILVEWIRGRRVDPRKEMLVHLIGLALLLLIAMLVSYGDIMRLVSGEPLLP